MRRINHAIYAAAILAMGLMAGSCDVHEFPALPETEGLLLRLTYEPEMTEWNHLYDGDDVVEMSIGDTYDNTLTEGVMRYVIRTYPLSKTKSSSQAYTQEFVFTKDISEGYDSEFYLDLLPGDYSIMVWSDLVEEEGGEWHYDDTDFSEITLYGDHQGDNDYCDAFMGTENYSLTTDILEHAVDTLDIVMQRPLAKYEFISTDLGEFLARVQMLADQKAAAKSKEEQESADGRQDAAGTNSVDISNYRVVFYYVGFMPSAYSLFTDKPVDSTTGVTFGSNLSLLSRSEASLGFDYVLVNGAETAVTVRVALYDDEGEMLSLTESIPVPLMRSRHTILRGDFLTKLTSGGINIDPGYEGDYNLVL